MKPLNYSSLFPNTDHVYTPGKTLEGYTIPATSCTISEDLHFLAVAQWNGSWVVAKTYRICSRCFIVLRWNTPAVIDTHFSSLRPKQKNHPTLWFSQSNYVITKKIFQSFKISSFYFVEGKKREVIKINTLDFFAE